MTVLAGVLIRTENMNRAFMACLAFDMLEEYMFPVAVRFVKRQGTLRHLVHVAAFATLPRLFPAVRLGKRFVIAA